VLLAAAPPWHEASTSVDVPGGKLYGTLTIPPGAGPFPVALIIAGSGPTDRNGNGPLLESDAYKLLAHGLAERGIATLRYDKRTIGQSAMPGLREEDLRFEMFASDAVVLVDHLKADARFRNISIIGHSEGSLIGILAAERDSNVAGLISLEGAGRDPATILVEQFREGGASQPVVAAVAQITDRLRRGKTDALIDPSLFMEFRPSVQPYLISWFRYDPAVEIEKLHVPLLIVQGTHDIQIGLQDARRLKSAAPNASLLIIPGMNHVLRDAPADRAKNVATYDQPTLPLSVQLVPAIANFIAGLP